jgi:hypothetical protein
MTADVPAMLFSQMTPEPDERERFEGWYDGDHIPNRLKLDGFRGAYRYWQDGGSAAGAAPHHLAIYDLDSLEALGTPGYARLKQDPGPETEYFLGRVAGFTRFTTELEADYGDTSARGDWLSVVAFAVPEEDQAALARWYDEEHVPLLLKAADWLRVHRYRVVNGDGGPWTHLALHELASAEVMDSPERARARTGPLRDALADRPWFRESGRWLYRRVAQHSR